jgi:hypothetical protein
MVLTLDDRSAAEDATAHGADGTATLRLHVTVPGDASARRSGEPVTAGLPLPRGLWRMGQAVRLQGPDGQVPVQTTVLNQWPDGSARWVLLDFAADAPAEYDVTFDAGTLAFPGQVTGIRLRQESAELSIDTGSTAFRIPRTGSLRIETTPGAHVAASSLVLEATGANGQALPTAVQESRFELAGPIRTVAVVKGTIGAGTYAALRFVARFHFFSGSAVVRCEVTLANRAPASHPGGYWELGDPGSALIRDLSIRLTAAGESRGTFCQPEPGAAPLPGPFTFELFQESSGGENWQSTVHVNRDNHVALRTRGYRMRISGKDVSGLRAAPVAWLDVDRGRMALGMQHFWQNFPKALECRGRDLILRLFPQQSADLHEIQGGEQKTHVFHAAFGRDLVTADPLAWVRQPALAAPGPDWFAHAEAVPYLTPSAVDPNADYVALVNSVIDGPHAFQRSRETIDEYGWRNFGDIYADHETVFHEGGTPLVSHYNNQYDAVAGFATQFLRSGDPRWWSGMNELAAHVRDIDIYHTDADKAAYTGGLFWHTCHYVDAGRSTHRSYPQAPNVPGGGPCNEHAYSTGLMLHYFLTGDTASREAAIGLADWIVRMDDGAGTPLKWLTRAATGKASSTYSPDYHGPGRGAGNAIVVLLNALRLTGDEAYLQKAEALIRRCIHPEDDIDARQLLDAERRWSYTVFLQALARYLDEKILAGACDAQYGYARAALLRYARWMAKHERPYLDEPDRLEYPTETWAAQDMRKSDVFKHAARHAGPNERAVFLERSAFFFRRSIEMLLERPTRFLARPRVILLSCGYMHAAFANGAVPSAPAPEREEFAPAVPFTTQRAIARRRLIVAGIGTAATIAAGLAAALIG